MKVSFINESYQRFFRKHRKEIMRAFEKCAKKGDFMLRDETRRFERKLADYIGTKYAVGVNSCTDAMFLSLVALGIKKGDEVICPSHTFIATIQSIIHTGATPVLVDVGEDELMDMQKVRKAITPKTKAIIPVHFHGKICDMSALFYIMQANNLFVVEDVAQALGANRGGKMAGSFGVTGCFSFNFPKLMGAYGDAGAITTDNEELFKKLLLLRNHWNITQGSVDAKEYPQPEEMEWGWKSRIDNIQAAILNVKFKYLDKLLARRKKIAEKYNKAFANLPNLEIPNLPEGCVVQEYILKTSFQKEFVEHMKKCGVELLIRDTIPNHKLKGLGLDQFNLPVTERIAQNAVRLPIYPELTSKEQSYIIKCVRKYYGSNKSKKKRIIEKSASK